jgi:hypothetical protein
MLLAETSDDARERRLIVWTERGHTRDDQLGPRMVFIWALVTAIAVGMAWWI